MIYGLEEKGSQTNTAPCHSDTHDLQISAPWLCTAHFPTCCTLPPPSTSLPARRARRSWFQNPLESV